MLLFLTHKVELIPPCDIEIAKNHPSHRNYAKDGFHLVQF